MPTRQRHIREVAQVVLEEWALEAREWSRFANMGGPAEPCSRCLQGMTPIFKPWGRRRTHGGVYACMTCHPLHTIELIEETKREAFAEAERRIDG